MYVYNKNQITINVLIDYKPKNKHMYLRLGNDVLIISSFKKLKPSQIDFLIDENIIAIKKLMNKAPKLEQKDQIHIFGKSYNLEIITSRFNKIEIIEDKVIVFSKNSSSDYIRVIIQKYYVSLTKEYIITLLEETKKVFEDVCDSSLAFGYKYLKTCYGKCNVKKNLIVFSGICAKVDKKYIKYVIFHEFAHLKYLGHQSDFYTYLESKLPQAKAMAKELRRFKYQDKY